MLKVLLFLIAATPLLLQGPSAYAATLTASEIRAEMLGKNIKTRRFGLSITMRYRSNGIVMAKTFLGKLKGTWRPRGNRICTTFPSGPAKGTSCVSFTRLGNGRYRSSEGVAFTISR